MAFIHMDAIPVLHDRRPFVRRVRIARLQISYSDQSFLDQIHVLARDRSHCCPNVEHALALDMAARRHAGCDLDLLVLVREYGTKGLAARARVLHETIAVRSARFQYSWV